MRILLDYRPALRQRTGVGEYAHHLACALVDVVAPGDELVLFSSSWKDRLDPTLVPGARAVDVRVPVLALNLAWHRFGWPPVDRFAGPVDVTQAMHPISVPSHNAVRFITVNDLYFLQHPEHTAAEIRRDYASLARRQAQEAGGIIVISEFMKGMVERHLGADPARMVVCPPGAPTWTRRAAPVHGGPILFVGTIEPRKNVGGLLAAYSQLINTRPDAPPLVLAGRPGPLSDVVMAEANRPELVGRVQFAGYVSDEQRQRLYAEASMLVLPSHDEGFGMPVLEAMTVGVPVIASDSGALPEVLAGAGLLVKSAEPPSIAAAMARVLAEPSLREHLVEAGLRRARAFSWKRSASELYAAYVEAVGRRRVGS